MLYLEQTTLYVPAGYVDPSESGGDGVATASGAGGSGGGGGGSGGGGGGGSGGGGTDVESSGYASNFGCMPITSTAGVFRYSSAVEPPAGSSGTPAPGFD